MAMLEPEVSATDAAFPCASAAILPKKDAFCLRGPQQQQQARSRPALPPQFLCCRRTHWLLVDVATAAVVVVADAFPCAPAAASRQRLMPFACGAAASRQRLPLLAVLQHPAKDWCLLLAVLQRFVDVCELELGPGGLGDLQVISHSPR